jgi:RHS repeat-associated protein
VDKTGDTSSGSATSYNMASLTPSGTGELYFGLAVVGGDTATAGSTSGVTYNVDDNGNLLAYDTNVSAALAPAGSQTGGTGVDSAAALFIASSGSCGTTTTTAATTTTTHPTTTTTAGTTTTTHATTTTTSGTTTTTGCSSSSITAVGSLAERFGSNTLSVSPVNSGDIEALAIQGQPESSPVVSSVSGGGVTTWSKAIAYPGSGTSSDIEIWWGTITSTGSSTITVTWTGSNPSYRELDAHEFSAGSGTTWSVDKTGDASNSSATSYNMASLTPSGTGELYFGLAVVGGDTATAGSTSGVTYNVDDNGNLLAYDTNVSAALAPAGSQTGGTGVDSAAALFIASSGSCGGTTTTTAGTTTTTHPTTTTTSGTTTTTSGGGSGTITYLVNLAGGVLLEVTGSTETWYYPNLEGGTAAEASSAGAAVGGITLYDPFGNALTSLQNDSPDGLAYGFEGKHGIGTDTDAGDIVLMGARLYNPVSGRFLQVDPVFEGSCNAYDYTCQDPLNNTDLNGEWCWFGTIGTTCTRYVTDLYGRVIPISYKVRNKILVKHDISWGTLEWLASNLPQVSADGTRVVYGAEVYELNCSDAGCVPTGRSVYVTMTVDFRTNTASGTTYGLVTTHCILSGTTFCPSWINSDLKL